VSQITRRHLLAGAAATAACAAMPAAAIAEQGFDLDRFLEVAVAETERLHQGVNSALAETDSFIEALSEAKRLSQLVLGDTPITDLAFLYDEDGKLITGDVEIVSCGGI
jgi:hypothetical protein